MDTEAILEFEEKEALAQGKFGKSVAGLHTSEQLEIENMFQRIPLLYSAKQASKMTQMSMEEKNRIAQERYGKTYDELSTNEQKAVGGTHGGETRKQEMAEEHGGDVSKGYSEMGRTQKRE